MDTYRIRIRVYGRTTQDSLCRFTTSSVPAAGDSGDLKTTYWQKIKQSIHEHDIFNNLELVKPGGN